MGERHGRGSASDARTPRREAVVAASLGEMGAGELGTGGVWSLRL